MSLDLPEAKIFKKIITKFFFLSKKSFYFSKLEQMINQKR